MKEKKNSELAGVAYTEKVYYIWNAIPRTSGYKGPSADNKNLGVDWALVFILIHIHVVLFVNLPGLQFFPL